jgi:hypothetical protein
VDQATSQAQHFDIVGDDGVILLGTYTSWAGRFPATTTATGNHTVMFDYWSDNDSVTWSIDNDGINDNDYNTTLTANKKKQTFSKTVNLTSTGSSTMYMRPHATGSKVYVANYRFFKDGTAWNDLSGKGNDGTISGATFAVDSTAGPYLDFDGTDDYVSVANDSTLSFGSSGDFTLEVVVKLDTADDNEMSIGKENGHFGQGYSIRLEESGSSDDWGIQLHAEQADGTQYRFISTQNIEQGYTHIIAVFDRSSTTARLYINGADGVNGTSMNANLNALGDLDVSQDFTIGSDSGGARNIDGRIAIVRVYSKALNDKEARENFNAERNRFGI